MKGKKKLILPLMLAGVTATSGYFYNVQQAVTVKAEDTSTMAVVGNNIELKDGFKDKYSLGEDGGRVNLPRVTVSGDAYKYTVTKGGKSITVQGDHASGYYFIATQEGYYNVSVETTDTGKVKTQIKNMSVWVEKGDATINLVKNSKHVIPAKIPVSQDNFLIPAPTITIGDSTEATKVTELEAGSTFAVKLITPAGETKTLEQVTDLEETCYKVNKEDLTKAGTYTIVYEYAKGGSVISRLESNFQVVADYDTSKISLNVTLDGSIPSTGNVNTEIKLPKAKVTESKNSLDAINSYVEVKIRKIDGAGKDVSSEFNYDNYMFTPSEEGDYLVSYQAFIGLFGDNCKSSVITKDQTIKVTDKKSATVRPTYEYEVDNTGKITSVNGVDVNEDDKLDDLLKNTKATIPSAVKLGADDAEVEVNLPAIYGDDNLSGYNDIKFERSVRNPNGSVTIIDATAYPNNKVAKYKFTTAGTYEVRYKATDKAGNPAGYAEYSVVVYKSSEDMTAGKTDVELNIPVTSVSDRDSKLTFAAPTARDTYDKSIEVKTFVKLYKSGETSSYKTVELTEMDGTKMVLDVKKMLSEKKIGDTSLELSESETIGKIDIYAEAYVDGTLVGTRTAFDSSSIETASDGSIVVKSAVKSIKVIDSNSDNQVPVLSIYDTETSSSTDWNTSVHKLNLTSVKYEAESINEHGYAVKASSVIEQNGNKMAAFDQNNQTVLTIPTFRITDADENLSISLSITDGFGGKVSKVNAEKVTKETVGSTTTYTVSDATFKLSTYGVYTVTIEARDIGGNITAQSYGIRVNDKTAPTIDVQDTNRFKEDIEVGKKFEVPAAKLIKNGETVEGTITWNITKVSGNAEYKIVGQTGFVPLSEGTFTISYSATDTFGNEATLENSMFTVTAKDTTDPEMKISQTAEICHAQYAWNDTDRKVTVRVPLASAWDGKFEGIDYGYGKDLEVVYSVSGPNSTTPVLKDVEGEDYKTFEATAQGKYVVTYKATDTAGRTVTKTREISVGDCEAPTLTWKTDEPKTAELNKDYVLDLSNIVLKDNETSLDDLKQNLTITLTNSSGSKVENKGRDGVNCIWNLKDAGTYTLKFSLKDKAGNTNSYSYQITVPEEEISENKVSPVLGTILVVAAVVVLAGVVIYFVVSSKKGKTTKSSRKKSTK